VVKEKGFLTNTYFKLFRITLRRLYTINLHALPTSFMEGLFMQWYVKVLKNYIGFQGRARRKEYWMFFLFNFLITLLLSFIEVMMGLGGILSGIYGLFVLLPSIAVNVRRLHDIGKTGWWMLLSFIPVIGLIVLLVFAVLDSQPGENKYGPNPKGQ
jgi:uncharacterized membrane protein YhaH (DUF805 family)